MMFVKAFTTFQYRMVTRAIHDQWFMQRSVIRARTVQVMDQLRSAHLEDFQAYVEDLVCLNFLCLFHSLFICS